MIDILVLEFECSNTLKKKKNHLFMPLIWIFSMIPNHSHHSEIPSNLSEVPYLSNPLKAPKASTLLKL